MSASNESFVLHYRTYEGDTQVESCPIVVIHGLLGIIRHWHEFCKSYSELTGRKVTLYIILPFPKFSKLSGRHVLFICPSQMGTTVKYVLQPVNSINTGMISSGKSHMSG